jgi:hypothetical protein
MGVNLFLTMLLARYFIIIDDIREASDWEEIKWAFPDTNNLGSRILITTRVTSIAEACCSRYSCDGLVLKMEPLNQNDSARLLLAKVVGSVDGCLPHNMKLLCDEILRRWYTVVYNWNGRLADQGTIAAAAAAAAGRSRRSG